MALRNETMSVDESAEKAPATIFGPEGFYNEKSAYLREKWIAVKPRGGQANPLPQNAQSSFRRTGGRTHEDSGTAFGAPLRPKNPERIIKQ